MLPRSFREMKNHPVRSGVSGSGPAEFFLHGWGRINLRRSYGEGERLERLREFSYWGETSFASRRKCGEGML